MWLAAGLKRALVESRGRAIVSTVDVAPCLTLDCLTEGVVKECKGWEREK